MAEAVARCGDIFADRSVLEVGCGYGENLAALAPRSHSVVGVDLRFDEARRLSLARRAATPTRPSVALATADALPFRDAAFDTVFSINSFEHFADPKRCFSECLRVTRPGGWLYFSFSPLFFSAWGAHLYGEISVPHFHNVYVPAVVATFLEKHGFHPSHPQTKEQFLQHPYAWMNRWTAEQFRSLFRGDDRAHVVSYDETFELDHTAFLLAHASHVQVPSVRSLFVSGIDVLLMRKDEPRPSWDQDCWDGCSR